MDRSFVLWSYILDAKLICKVNLAVEVITNSLLCGKIYIRVFLPWAIVKKFVMFGAMLCFFARNSCTFVLKILYLRHLAPAKLFKYWLFPCILFAKLSSFGRNSWSLDVIWGIFMYVVLSTFLIESTCRISASYLLFLVWV